MPSLIETVELQNIEDELLYDKLISNDYDLDQSHPPSDIEQNEDIGEFDVNSRTDEEDMDYIPETSGDEDTARSHYE